MPKTIETMHLQLIERWSRNMMKYLVDKKAVCSTLYWTFLYDDVYAYFSFGFEIDGESVVSFTIQSKEVLVHVCSYGKSFPIKTIPLDELYKEVAKTELIENLHKKCQTLYQINK